MAEQSGGPTGPGSRLPATTDDREAQTHAFADPSAAPRHAAVVADEAPTSRLRSASGDDSGPSAAADSSDVASGWTIVDPATKASLTSASSEGVSSTSPATPAADPAAGPAEDGTASTPPAIEVVNLHKRFGDNVAVENVSFSVARGSILALLGPNGAGKTTTVNMLCTLLKPDGGSAVVDGHDVTTDAAGVRRSIMLTGQFAALDEALSGRDNLILFGRLMGLPRAAARSRADELLASFELTAAAKRKVGEYSGGMRRRIDIACGLVTQPSIVFLDEPTTGLDPRSRQEVWKLVESLRRQGVTTLLTTQYLEEADTLSDHIVVIDKGRVIASGTADELKAATGASHYQVTPTDPDDLHRLLGCLLASSDTGTPGISSAEIPAAGGPDEVATFVTVPATAGADTLVEIVQRTKDAGIRLSDVALCRPSLDEVFLALTDPANTTAAAPTSHDDQSPAR
ncbi:ATP-binding cassette domain-containing protein [Gordonia sp. SID5947]|uniref:ATP-binding cassette domain-containing protein n=1 Tax=Gordonia sp. SID5947 TaxID=2690315 RepID=UPI0013716A08|nr:ATP-binding cassette domain-containing protein [Gordonia sp. SID5947]MYR08763.1 ATP-binding cassette domain-containing protein [Gordonia sp. SID5947]